MHRNTKIATCCYCGTRAALVLGDTRHELVCAACGAPLRHLKALHPDPVSLKSTDRRAAEAPFRGMDAKRKRPKKRKKRKPAFMSLLEDVLDDLDDIFD
ncbi:hypothetical protein [Tropicimonas marinistellae]|uniref:hypothetical protein n=1 Tax=Tropicimonas marinistellae TaxID=1739787 RepID=UPI00082BBEA5|nr:hypothetical protein [Tropicimonas marinistellae]